MKKVVSIAPLYPDTQDKLEELYEIVRLYSDGDVAKTTEAWLKDCEVAVTNSGRGADVAELERLPNLRLVANFGTGLDKTNLQYCKEHGITVTHTPDVLTDDVAHLAICLMLSTIRCLPAAERFLRGGQWLMGKISPDPLSEKHESWYCWSGKNWNGYSGTLRTFWLPSCLLWPQQKRKRVSVFP